MSWLETVTMENCLFCLICQEVSNLAELPTNSAMLLLVLVLLLDAPFTVTEQKFTYISYSYKLVKYQ